ncbi:MAG: ComEC/Rec2 family competence protein, partial [Acidimicrobiia bacterium]
VAGAIAAWGGVAGWWWLPAALLVGARIRPAVIGRAEKVAFLVVFAIGTIVGWAESEPPDPLPAGPVTFEGRVHLDLGDRWGWSGLVLGSEGMVLVQSREAPDGDRIVVRGDSDGAVSRVLGRWVIATVDADEIAPAPAGSWHASTAERLRARIISEIRPEQSTARGLLVGFLIGDTAGVSPVVSDEMRRAGLSHLVAVSGSNVALFLAGLIVVFAPLAIHRVGRVALVLNGLLVFGVLTRWEPSVVRAAAMAGLVVVGRFVGVPLEPVTALAVVGGASILIEPGLLGSVGFQLSMLATAGLITGARLWPGQGRVRTLLTATVAAQLAVAPLLLAVFGTVPLLSPLANLVAIPLVTVATGVAGTGSALGVGWLVAIAEVLAEGFVAVARVAAPWPQLTYVSFAAVVAGAAVCVRFRRVRLLAACVAAIVVAASMVSSAAAPSRGVVFFDVGQGDAALVRLSGFTILIDGGPDPALLAATLARYGVDRIDLAVVTHVHSDHAAGLAGIIARIPVGRIWEAFEPHETDASRAVIDSAKARGIPVERPTVGGRLTVGSDTVDVLGPKRRYHSPNDQSIVLLVTIDGTRILFSGDVETVAQAELTVRGVDVLKVPHQGAATSEPDWLAAHAGSLAVVSVGKNAFGHPVPWVIETLRSAGAEVLRTDEVGDVVLDLDGGPALHSRGRLPARGGRSLVRVGTSQNPTTFSSRWARHRRAVRSACDPPSLRTIQRRPGRTGPDAHQGP